MKLKSELYKKEQLEIMNKIISILDLDDNNSNITQLYVNYAMDVSGKFEFNNKYKLEHKCGLFLLDKESNKKAEQIDDISYLSSEKELTFNDYAKYWVNSMFIESNPDTGIIAFEIIRNEDDAVSSNHFEYNIIGFSNNELAVSDILLATEVTSSSSNKGAIVRRNHNILPNPMQIFTTNNNIFIYYEAYNLHLDDKSRANFEQRITIRNAKESSVFEDIFASIGFFNI